MSNGNSLTVIDIHCGWGRTVAARGWEDPAQVRAALAARALGPQRIVFASGAPAVSLRSALALVRLANLGPENEEMVLSGNARRILGSSGSPTAAAAGAA